MRKNVSKNICALAALTVAAICSGETLQRSAVIMFHIKNTLSVPIYGNIYETYLDGSLYDPDNVQYFTVKEGGCISLPWNKLVTPKDRATKYSRIIFATDAPALKRKIEQKTKEPQVASKVIPQKNLILNVFSREAQDNEYYEVGGTNDKPKIDRKKKGNLCHAQQITANLVSAITEQNPR